MSPFLAYFTFVITCADLVIVTATNNRPIIGVVAQESTKWPNVSIITASYVKFVEASGARVVPILINQPPEYYRYMFEATNGVLFPGGLLTPDQNFLNTGYARAGQMFYDFAIEANNNGDFYPIWGTCLGLELLTILINNGTNPLSRCWAEDLLANIDFVLTTDQLKNTKMFHNVADEKVVIEAFKQRNVTINYHDYCLNWDKFKGSTLPEMIRPIAVNMDWNQTRFLSIFESKKYPFYAVHFHPEIVLFEFEVTDDQRNVPHDASSVLVSQYLSRFFVSEARKSPHGFRTQAEEKKALIFNYEPVYTGIDENSDDEQVYIFK